MHRWFASLHVALSIFVQLFRYSFTATPARYFTADFTLNLILIPDFQIEP